MQRPTLFLLPFVFLAGAAAARLSGPRAETLEVGGFSITQEVVVPVEPERAYELFTADVAEWWDHCFSGDPSNLSMDARPGGFFLERLGEGQGVVHAEFTFVKRGERLVMRGPLGFHGRAFDLVCSIEFTAEGEESTRVRAEARAAGELQPGWDQAVEGVWKHFLDERFRPYAEQQAQ